MSDILLEAKNVQKSFNGVPALHNGQILLKKGSVHALCGGNGAGKSTFLNILMGLLKKDAGEILVKGNSVDFTSPIDAINHKIAIITQELSPIPGMTVAENIFLGNEPRLIKGIIDYKKLFTQTQHLLDTLGFEIQAKNKMSELSLAQTQLVEIAKVFNKKNDIIIMDEPTSSIGEKETETLFAAIRSVTQHGAGIIYVSHRLSEIFTIADTYTVFRNGGYIESGQIEHIDRAHLVQSIVGRELTETSKENKVIKDEVIFKSDKLSRHSVFSDISLEVKSGEILGIYGLVGSGRSEFLDAVYGITNCDSGDIYLKGQRLLNRTPIKSIQSGISYITEDRKDTGLVLDASIQDNIAYSSLGRLSYYSIIDLKKIKLMVNEMVNLLKIKITHSSLAVKSLSGGNQQKVVIARCVSTDPVFLLCDEPTRGIDEGAKQEVYHFLETFVSKGNAAIVVSSEAPEILKISDRIIIFKNGKVVGNVLANKVNQEELLHLAS
ncbi:sugar ABC transporter ATP-binding protein [Thorsellia anophelis]|uniref:Monosaccharide ABC transporter ATP-binding protein, CUT2 family n=1 Tax=Thorsellia anophelis DSM 18579 TaxID=1123402 RepID=A0A1I0AEY4_9GAMM|nr:sugar ABC transporter ATP-binding protein [Thorsellia anophelis]SES92248.1 monosaccharide ABC transporter ATP-binding protein, CUT2 family [Thorsellia anophelis DSM 18579]